MLQILIDSHPIVLKDGTQIKLTRENPYFTSAGDYTLDVVLPLAGCRENIRAIGFLHRPEISLTPQAGRRLPFTLAAAGITISGHAVVTSITEEEAKLQLIGGISDLRNTEEKINSLPLGRAWDDVPATHIEDDAIGSISDSLSMAFYFFHDMVAFTGEDGKTYNIDKIMHGKPQETSAVAFPIHSTADDLTANKSGIVEKSDEQRYYAPISFTHGSATDNAVIAPQPYIIDVIRRVLQSQGRKLVDRCSSTNPIRYTFVANSRATLEIARMLPEWTVQEFIMEVENFFGVAFLHGDGGEVLLVDRHNYYGLYALTITITQAIDETTADIDEEDNSRETSLSGNVDYDYDDADDILRLPDEVFENCEEQIDMDNYTAIFNHAKGLSEEERARSRYLYTDRQTGRRYAFLNSAKAPDTYSLHEVDMFGPLIRRGDRDIDTKLRIVPLRYDLAYSVIGDGQNPTSHVPVPVEESVDAVPVLRTPDTLLQAADNYSINEAINQQEDTEGNETAGAPDRLYVAYNDGSIDTEIGKGIASDGNIFAPLPIGIPYARDPESGLPEIPRRYYRMAEIAPPNSLFALNDRQVNDTRTIAAHIAGGPQVDTRVVRQFTVIDRDATDPTAIYIIRGRRYVCQKIELTLDAGGVKPEKKLYLYELN